jgi:transcriptional regulator with GAF, ATPase, and Fis domain
MLGESSAMRTLRDVIAKVAPTPARVLIQGESGTGKELVARLVHEMSPRAQGPFVAVNCGAIPRELIESELFGHEKGAFTGAVDRQKGMFEQADGGTLFLDEVGELPLELQPALLRAVQFGEIRSVGSDQVRHVDVRLVAATHRDLRAKVQDGSFREDLYYRLAVLEIDVPPLASADRHPLSPGLPPRPARPTAAPPPPSSPTRPSRSSRSSRGPATSVSSRTSPNAPSSSSTATRSTHPRSRACSARRRPA